jgi:hypothetical protein
MSSNDNNRQSGHDNLSEIFGPNVMQYIICLADSVVMELFVMPEKFHN